MKEKDDDDSRLSIKDLDLFLNEDKDLNQSNLENNILNENNINNLSEILNKLKSILEQLNQFNIKNRQSTNNSKRRKTTMNNSTIFIQSRIENANLTIKSLDQLINLLSNKNINRENELNDNLINISNLLKDLQVEFYSNAKILKKINLICGLIINNLSDNDSMKIFLEIMIESLNYIDNNNKTHLLIMSLKFIYNTLKKNSFNLIEGIYDITLPKIYNILNLSKSNDSLIKIFCYKILTLFSHNNVFSYDLVNKGILVNIKEVLEEIKNNKNNELIIINNNDNDNDNYDIKNDINDKNNLFEINTNTHINEENNNINNKINESMEKDYNESNTDYNDIIKQIYILLKYLIDVDSNANKISEELMKTLLDEFLDDNYSKDKNIYIKIDFFELIITKEPKSIDSFIKSNGMQCILKLLQKNRNNKKIILQLFNILIKILMYNKSYNDIVVNLNFYEHIKEIMERMGDNEKDIEFKGKSVLFLINFEKKKLEEIEECDFKGIQLIKVPPPKPHVINFLNNGKIVKIVNNLGEIKTKYLYFTQDLLKVIAKKMKSKLPPKQKYIIETMNITSVVKGHGTDAFKKSKRFYRSVPNANKCFSIIAFNHSEGYKSINVICDKETDINKWVNYIKDLIVYFQDNKRIQRNINFSK